MTKIVEDSFLYTIADEEFYEPLDRYRPMEDHFLDPVRRILPQDWVTDRTGPWFHCHPPHARIPDQGWKIHVSATLGNSVPVLATVVRLLVREAVPFKFAIDKLMLYFLNFKRWPRGGAGKFITVYPTDVEQCRALLESLHRVTVGFDGPYILSDRRYKDGIVFYRYGGLLPVRVLDEKGGRTLVVKAADGALLNDDRLPYFQLPPGVADPFLVEEPSTFEGDFTLKEGRYRIESALAFSNTGGVYRARDTETGTEVLIKEARPFTNTSNLGTDAVYLLKKEYRLLAMLEDAVVAPRPMDFFKQWEHFYLVEEFVEGVALRYFIMGRALALRTRPTPEAAKAYYDDYRRVFLSVANALKVLHDRGIVFGDLSLLNLLVLDEEGTKCSTDRLRGRVRTGRRCTHADLHAGASVPSR